MKITKDNFVWLIVTDNAVEIWDKKVFDLYILYDDDSESLVENYKELVLAIDNGLQIGIEVGHIELKPKQ
jgi:hypothetical protein